MRRILILILCLAITASSFAQVADKATYLTEFKTEMQKTWPENRTLNIVFHGHSVPSGYANTPVVNTLQAYPHLTLCSLKTEYPYAVLNVITTSIGGENAEQGEVRFESEALTHKPDVLLIDYSLNDRGIGLERAEKAWRKMIESALAVGIKLILLTPTPDLTEDILDENTPLAGYANLVRSLAAEYNVGLVDAYGLFKEKASTGEDLQRYMSQCNHPNSVGHSCVAAEIMTWFL